MHHGDLRGRDGEGRAIRPLSFRKKQFFALLTLAIVPLLAAGGVALPYARDAVIARASAQLNTVADLKSILVHTWLSQGQDMVQLAGELREVEEMLPLLLSPPDQPALARAKLNLELEINILSNVFPLVRSVSLLHPDTGRVLVSTDPTLEGRDRREDDYFREGRKGPFISPVHYSLGREEPVLIVSAPVIRPKASHERCSRRS